NGNDANQRLDKYLSKSVKLLPQSLLYKYLRLKRIKINGKRSEISYKLQEGDLVSLYINDEFFAEDKPLFLLSNPQINVVYEDENILLVDKPQGLIVHEDDGESVDTLINRVQHYLYQKGEYLPAEERSFAPALCNRIDRNTGGIVIVAKNALSLRILNEKIKSRELHKYYLALVKGTPNPRFATLTHYHRKDERENKALVYEKPRSDTKTMITKYSVLQTNGKYSLVEIDLKTGRFHQIRAHMAYIGCPLVGDGKYASNQKEKKLGFAYQALYSYKLQFDFESDCELSYLNHKTFQVQEVWFAKNGIPDILSE
ncbi:MAG: RluA family pseudouridine synthase, partial [Oscillospiraceae bacterium]